MPTRLQDFHYLDTLKLHNSTVREWSDESAVMNQHHPVLASIYVVRVTFTDGRLPPGLVSNNIPSLLYDFEFIGTNLRTLPDDLDMKWPLGATIYFELRQFDHFPAVLTRLEPISLSLAAYLLTEFPVETLQTPSLIYLSVAAIPITTLSTTPYAPNEVTESLITLFLMETNVSLLPRWIDPFLARGMIFPSVNLHNAPLCTIQEIEAGTRSYFPAVDTTPLDELATVMTIPDVEGMGKAIRCKFYIVLLYPLAYEDRVNALTPQVELYP